MIDALQPFGFGPEGERPACRQDGHGTGLRALLSKDGESWDWGKDYMVLSEQDDRYPTVPASGCECGYGK